MGLVVSCSGKFLKKKNENKYLKIENGDKKKREYKPKASKMNFSVIKKRKRTINFI